MVVEEPNPNNAESVEKSDSGTAAPEPVKIFTVESESEHPTERELR